MSKFPSLKVEVTRVPALKKVLIANRGEIALRIVRACAEMGIASVAVYSEADRTSLHVRAADEAYLIGPSPSSESYLRMDRLIDAAQASGAEAIHPGYGFLAENADFGQQVQESGLVWIGPPPEAMRKLGDKLAARQLAIGAGVPVVPGTDVAVDDPTQALGEAEKIGYPVLIKASAGGGGKGMRVVQGPGELEAALRTASSEATSSFGSGVVYLEKYLSKVRHVEIQFIGDSHGNIVHLGERECSIQRRHQKLIEEAPSVAVNAELRERIGSVAVAAARAAGYYSAGTCEFLLDDDGNFYFLEVNARLQVEHPVTELVTGIDLVIEQIRVASGERLSFSQEDVQLRGHAIECRIVAEDPYNNFVPSLGQVSALAEPSGPGVRVDSALYRGGRVPIYYDPMLAKLIVWAPTREHAILRMLRALEEYRIVGLQTIVPFHISMMQNDEFKRGDIDTGFLQRHDPAEIARGARTDQHIEIASLAAALVKDRQQQTGGAFHSEPVDVHAAGATNGTNWRKSARTSAMRGC
jgi:acetyl-CoA carboxylase, biotin carboxylase subunit